MPTDAKTGLFETLPEQMAAARPVGVPRLRQAERRQVSLRTVSPEDLLPRGRRTAGDPNVLALNSAGPIIFEDCIRRDGISVWRVAA